MKSYWGQALFIILIGAGSIALTLPSFRSSTVSSEKLRAFRRPATVAFPKSNPFSESKYHLGKTLFFDPRLSKNSDLACATCHAPSKSWTDGLPKAQGMGHRELSRRTPTLWNLAWSSQFFWDGRASSLEEQALGPIQAVDEMGMPLDLLVTRLSAIPGYRDLFERAFPGEALSSGNIAKAIATFERTLISSSTPFDHWVETGHGISESAQRGFSVFNDKAHCVRCHTGWAFTNGTFADVGLPSQDAGKGKFDRNPAVQNMFKTPTLRDVARRSYFMHDGSLKTLREVIENYDQGGTVKRATTKIFFSPLGLNEGEKRDLISFLESLSGNEEPFEAPTLPPDHEEKP